MGSSSKGKAPAAPDPVQTAGAQTGMNIGTAVAQQSLNNVNQNTPYGSLNYNQTGMKSWKDPLTGKVFDLPQYTATQTLSKGQQALYDKQLGAQTSLAGLAGSQTDKLGAILGKSMSTANAPKVTAPTFQKVGAGPELATSYGDPGGYAAQRKSVEGALLSRINPQLAQDKAAQTAMLANQGIKQGTEAYDRAMQTLGQNANDARMQAVLAGGQEQSRLAGLDQAQATFGNSALQQMFGNKMAGAGFNNQQGQQAFSNQQGLRKDYLNEQYAARNQPINEIAALLGTGQVQNPNFVPTGGNPVANTDYAGLVGQNYNQKLAAWQQQQQQSQNMLGGLFGLGASGITAFSDRRMKTDVSFLGMLRDLPIYAWRYVWGGPLQIGVMAQEMLALRPDAVITTPSGYLAVDYGKL